MNLREVSTDGLALGSNCAQLERIATDFRPLVIAHCPHCNELGPECIVEAMHDALGAGRDARGPDRADVAD